MTWSFDPNATRMGPVDLIDSPVDLIDSVEGKVSEQTYPDHWWSDDFWLDLRAAGRYRWCIDRIQLPPPPAKDTTLKEAEDVLRKQLSSEAAVRRSEILEEADAPPPYYERMLFLDAQRRPLTGAILKKSVNFSRPFIMHFKHIWKRARPTQWEPRIRPVVPCPQHPAYPSGHSTQAHVVALVIGVVSGRDDIKSALWSAAARIASNREYAGLHYESDSAAGVTLATPVSELFISMNQDAIATARTQEWT